MSQNATKLSAAFGVALEVATGVIDTLPDILDLIEKHTVNAYELKACISGIGEENAAICVSADMATLSEINQELVGKCQLSMVDSGPFSVLFEADTPFITLIPASYEDIVRETIMNYLSLEEDIEAGTAPEEEEKDQEEPEEEIKEEPEEEEDDLEGYDTEDHGKKGRSSDMAKHKHVSSGRSSQSAPERTEHYRTEEAYSSIGGAEELRDDRYERSAESTSAKHYEDSRRYEERRTEEIRQEDARRREERKPEPEPYLTAASSAQSSVITGSGQHPSYAGEAGGYRKEEKDLEPGLSRRGASYHTVSGKATEVRRDTRKSYEEYYRETYKGIKPGTQGKTGAAEAPSEKNVQMMRLGVRHPEGASRKNEVSVDFSVPFNQKSASYEEAIEKREALKQTGMAGRSERYYTVGQAASSPHFDRALTGAKMFLGETIVPRDSEGGRSMHTVMDITSAGSALLYAKFMRAGVTSINQGIAFNREIYTSALYAAKGYTKSGVLKLAEGVPEYSIADAQKEVGDLIKDFAESRSGSGFNVNCNMAQLNEVLKRKGMQSFSRLISSMSKEQLAEFAKTCKLSDKMLKALLDTPNKYVGDVKTIQKLGEIVDGDGDKAFLQMLKGSSLAEKFGGSPLSFMIKSISRRLIYRGIGNSEGASGLRTVTTLFSTIKLTTKLGLKGIGKVAKKFGASEKTLKAIKIAQSPIRHTFGIAKAKLGVGTKAGTIKTGKVMGKFAKFQERLASRAAMKAAAKAGVNAAASAGTGAAAGAAGTTGAAAASGTAGAAGTGAASGAGGAAAGAGIGAGAVVAIIVVAVIILLAVLLNAWNDSESSKQVQKGNMNYVENTEIVDELVAEFDEMNTQFNVLINDAKNHRGDFASSVSYEGGETAQVYESYTVIFRDAYGNELDPETVDFNNTKAIIAMASKYFPYPFNGHSATDDDTKKSADQRMKYEEAKQYFKDYCYMLWAATHRITIEEYHPGDSDYAEFDDSGIATYLGKCDRDGTTVWLPEGLEPKTITNNETREIETCDSCSEYLATGYGILDKALCAHPFETYSSTDGWKKTGRMQTHILCPGHRVTEYGTDENGHRVVDGYHYEYCGTDRTPIAQHQHVSYEWKYVCGGHMSAVVYVTIGDVSRLPTMRPAKDVDFGVVGSYKTEE